LRSPWWWARQVLGGLTGFGVAWWMYKNTCAPTGAFLSWLSLMSAVIAAMAIGWSLRGDQQASGTNHPAQKGERR